MSHRNRGNSAWLVIGSVAALSVGIGAYFGSAQLADSANPPKRSVVLRIGDKAVLGEMQCVAVSDLRRHPMRPGFYYMRCSRRPLIHSRYHVDVWPDGAQVWDAGVPGPLYTTPR